MIFLPEWSSTITPSTKGSMFIITRLTTSNCSRRVWRYQRVIRICISKKKTTQWPEEKVKKDKQRSTKHTDKTKHWVTRTPLKTGVNSTVLIVVQTFYKYRCRRSRDRMVVGFKTTCVTLWVRISLMVRCTSSSNNKTLNARLLARVITGCHYT